MVSKIDLRNGDCVDVMKSIGDGTIDLTVTSPPYDNLRTYNGNNALWGEHVWRAAIEQLYRITKPGGVVVWVVGDATINGSETLTSFRQALWAHECGFNQYDTMIYMKYGAAYPSKSRYGQVFEYMFIWSKGTPKTINLIKDRKNKWGGKTGFGEKSQRNKKGDLVKKGKVYVNAMGTRFNVWLIANGYGFGSKDKTTWKHPATFPDKLARDHILSWSNAGDIVLDPFMGSGTTGVMAKQLNRGFIGIELDEGYFKLAEKRIKQAQSPLFA